MITIRRIWLRLLVAGWACCLAAVSAAALTVARRDNRLLIDGAPATLTFARSCTNPADLPAYQEMGFNTLLVTIDSPGPRVLDDADRLMTVAETRGLYLLVELANGAWSADQYADPASPEYRENCGYFLDAVVARLGRHPNLVGWVISTVDERKMVTEPGALRDFLAGRYGDFSALLHAWSETDANGKDKNTPRLQSWNHLASLTPAQVLTFARTKAVASRMQEDFRDYDALQANRDTGFRAFLQRNYPTAPGELVSGTLMASWHGGGKDWGIARWEDVTVARVERHEQAFPGAAPAAQLDLARYKSSVSPALLDWWAKEIGRRDPSPHRLFAGSQHAYRTLITLPRSLDGALTECYPGFAEADQNSQNPHAVDIARRGNQFIVLAGVLVRGVRPRELANVIYTAAVHGAAGLCLADWPALARAAGDGGDGLSPAETVRVSLQDIARRRLLGRTPAPTVALVYSPYVGGVRIGKSPLYGYLDNASFLAGPGTPGSLFFLLREGTSFGQFDYLSGDDLDRVPLARYRTLLMPSTLEIPLAGQKKLLAFVKEGGTVVADLGAGTVMTDDGVLTAQATNDLYTLPGPLMLLFRLRTTPGIERVRLNLQMGQGNKRFPHVLPGMRTNGVNAGYMITQLVRVTPLEGAQYLFTTVQQTGYGRPSIRPIQPLPLTPARGVFAYALGKGIAIYAPFPLYRYWLPDSRLFGEFHRDLFGLDAAVFLQRPIDFLPSLAEVARYDDGSVLAWTQDQTRPEVVVTNPGRQLFAVPEADGACQLAPDATVLQYARSGLHVAEPLPVTVLPTSLSIKVTTAENSKRGLAFTLGIEGGVTAENPVVLTVGSGRYPIAPASPCPVTVNGRTVPLTADSEGRLILTLAAGTNEITVGEPGGTSEVIFNVESPDDEHIIQVTPPKKD